MSYAIGNKVPPAGGERIRREKQGNQVPYFKPFYGWDGVHPQGTMSLYWYTQTYIKRRPP